MSRMWWVDCSQFWLQLMDSNDLKCKERPFHDRDLAYLIFGKVWTACTRQVWCGQSRAEEYRGRSRGWLLIIRGTNVKCDLTGVAR